MDFVEELVEEFNQQDQQQQEQQAQEPQQQQQDLPILFAILTKRGQTRGYYLVRWSHGGLDATNKIIHVLKPANHHNRFYNINAFQRTGIRWNNIVTKKNQGTMIRASKWKFVNERLHSNGDRIPVIRISPSSTTLPLMPSYAFVPITTNNTVQAPPVPVAPPVAPPAVPPVNITVTRKYPISTIPQHIVLSLLRDAVMQEEVCPITSENIDVANGAVTSCFHLFEKNAILQWLLMPSSQDKCPVCNCPCNSFTL
jgi:hypothetical protein